MRHLADAHFSVSRASRFVGTRAKGDGNECPKGDHGVDRDQFDNLTRRLFSRGGSRRTLLRLAGTLAVPGLPALGSPSARASAKKTCRRKKHGVYLAKGDCHCGFTCKAPDSDNFHCHSNTDCYCYETVAGTGFCGLLGTFSGCSSDTDCPTGQTCVVHRHCPLSGGGCENCPGDGGSCTDSTQCPVNDACLDGRCWPTLCSAPCPT